MVNFKRIELRGFKSFADRVEIPFHEGVTAIIGPNGCGKSNVADAIRWTLGEGSPKQLRGKKMQDVIFAGTEKRKSMSYCEVSLVFNNEDKRYFPTLPYDEVIVTRKLDRSGLSEYYLNRTRTRRTDIINLFRDTGVGRDGYSIIGQGKVREILSSKPTERRAIFEEAAGISASRDDRNKSLGDLAKAAANIANINEVIAEIERQIVPLKRQAEAATKYFALKDELKRKEVNLYLYKFENNRATKQKISANISATERDLKDKDAEFKSCADKYDACIKESQQIDIAYSASTAELTELKVDAEKMKGDAVLLKERIANVQADINRLGEDLKETDAELVATEQLILRAKEKKGEKLADYIAISKRLEALSERSNSLKRSLEGKESELARRNDEYVQAMEEYSSLKSNYTEFAAEKGMNEERARNLLELINQKKRSLDEQKTNAAIYESSSKACHEKTRECMTAYNEALYGRNEAKEAIKAYDDDIVNLNAKLGQAEGAVALYTNIKNEYSGYQDAVRHLMQDAKHDPSLASKIWGVVAQAINVPMEYEAAIEYALGGAMQNVLVESEEAANELIRYLKQKGYGRATFRPLTSCRPHGIPEECKSILKEPGCYGLACDLVSYEPKFEKFVQTLLGSTVVVNNIDNGVMLYKKYGRAIKIVTLDGEILARSGEITGGSRRNQTQGLLTQEKKIEIAKQNYEKIKNNIALLKTQRAEREEEVVALDAKLEEISLELSQLRTESGTLDEKSKRANDLSLTLEKEIEENSKEYERVRQNIKQLQDKLDSVDELERVTNQKREEFNALRETSKGDNSREKSESELLAEQVTELKLEGLAKKNELDTCEADLHRYTMQKESLEDDKLTIVGELKNREEALKNLMSAPQRTNFSAEDEKRIAELEQSIADFSERKRRLSDEITDLDVRKNRVMEERNAINEKRVRYENMLNNVDIEMNSMQAYILENYDLTYAGAKELRDDDFDPHGANAAITDLKRAIARLGDVNPLALETLKETEERLNKNLAQRDDLQKAHDDVLNIIDKITEKMKEQFMSAFVRINENFGEVFRQIFGGGRAELRLDDSETDDVLEQGIEIMAQLPGKKLQNLSLFSGGEETLIAISILFAILKLKPLPLCVLDEVEAALDDTNTNLFAEYLKKFSSETQFIVITHRKPTMSHADTIYGVTMEEKGVTKIVSIEFEEAVKQAKED